SQRRARALGRPPPPPAPRSYPTSRPPAALPPPTTTSIPYATLSRSSNYNAISSGTHNAETFFVDKGTLTLTTTVHDASHNVVADGAHVPLGSVMHDNASLSGATSGFTPTRAVTFSFSGGALGAAPANPEGSFYATSGSTAALAASASAYSFSAAYAGDSNYNAISSGTLNAQTFFVVKAPL